VKVTDRGKNSILLRNKMNYVCKKVYDTGPRSNYFTW
jgi:hypothetical protein